MEARKLYDVAAVKAAARGRWPEILEALAGIPRGHLDGKHHPCPWCGGTDRFRLVDADTGAVLCSKCFSTKNGDGIAAVMKGGALRFPQALAKLGAFVGLSPQNGHANGHDGNPLDTLCRAKRMPPASATAYGAKINGDCVVFPSWGPAGEAMATFTIKPSGTDKQRKGLWPKGGKAGIFMPVVDGKPRLPADGETWLVVEGVKDAAALHGLGYLAAGLNTCHLAQRFAPLFRGCKVVLVPDRDTASIDGMGKSAKRLYGVAAGIATAALPAEVTESSGKDVRDILAQADGEQLVRAAIEQATEWKPPAPGEPGFDNRPGVYAGPKEHEVATQAIAALAGLDGLYQRGGNLVSIVRDPEPPAGVKRPPGSLYICPVDEAALCDRLSQAVRFFQYKRQGDEVVEVDVPPPLRIAKIIQSRRQYPGVPVVEGIVHAPAFLADGSVLTARGYDSRTGLYLAGATDFPAVPQSPTQADAAAARDELLEVVCDFPFSTEAHRAAWLALALTPAARFAFDGPVPLGAFDANVRGSGKSKLADSIGMIHLGTELPRTAAPANDEEFRKRITSVLLGGEPIMLIDNVVGTLGCASLDALLTGTSWSDRILGLSKMTGRLAATTIWLASGNNLVFSADTARRALTCRIESREENPEEREGFRHPDLLGWVRSNRARLAVAAVTILRAYHVAGRPKMGLKEWGSFEGWSGIIRNAVVWCGMDDPGMTRQEVREQSDREAGLLRQLIAAWEDADPQGHGMTVQEAIAKAADGNTLLQAAFAEIGVPGKPPSSRSIGMKIHHLRGRVAGGKYFEHRRNPQNVTVWAVESTAKNGGQPGTTGTTGTKANRSYADAHAPAHAHARTHAHAGAVAVSSSGSSSSSGSPCNHLNPDAWIADGDKRLCPGCRKIMGRTKQQEAF